MLISSRGYDSHLHSFLSSFLLPVDLYHLHIFQMLDIGHSHVHRFFWHLISFSLTMLFHFFTSCFLFPLLPPFSFRFNSLIWDSKILGVMVIRKDAYHCNKHRGLRFSVTFVNGHIEVIYLGMVQCFNSTLVMAWLFCRDLLRVV